MENRYYIVEKTNPQLTEIINCVVENVNSLRESIDTTKVVVKLHKGDTENHPCLDGITEYNHQEILLEMAKPEWIVEI